MMNSCSCSLAQRLAFWQDSTGKERDETGLDYFLARYYSGAQGRFLSPDEFKGGPDDALTGRDVTLLGPLPYADITNPQSLNKYAYVYNNPLRYTDPDGHAADWILDALGLGYDIYDLVTAPSWSKAGTLGLDVVLAVVPFVPTVGGVKAGAKLLGQADDAVDAAKAVEKAVDAEKTAKSVESVAQRGGETASAAAGRQAHADFAAKVKNKPGWQSEPRLTDPVTNKSVKPDAVSKGGHPVELKPNTPSGRAAGRNQLPKYERATKKKGRVVYYEPD